MTFSSLMDQIAVNDELFNSLCLQKRHVCICICIMMHVNIDYGYQNVVTFKDWKTVREHMTEPSLSYIPKLLWWSSFHTIF